MVKGCGFPKNVVSGFMMIVFVSKCRGKGSKVWHAIIFPCDDHQG